MKRRQQADERQGQGRAASLGYPNPNKLPDLWATKVQLNFKALYTVHHLLADAVATKVYGKLPYACQYLFNTRERLAEL